MGAAGEAMPHRVFSLKEVADYLHVAESDVTEMVRAGEIPNEVTGGRPSFRRRAIDAWASRRLLGLGERPLREFHRKTSARHHVLSNKHALMPELVVAEGIDPVFPARTRSSVIREMAAMAGRTGLVVYPDDLLASLEERERLGSTALAGGVALLHPLHHEPYMFEDSFIVLARAVQPAPFGSPDGELTDLFFLVCCQDERIHLHLLARLCTMCHRTDVLAALRAAADAESMLAALVASEAEVVRDLGTAGPGGPRRT